ncbi:LacI family DNA-binding transcriptional regulator [Nonomuraea rubra]|uniref:LacI family transcriptional regulator n=1 Tax=Nonomuraea rubra TaxID=46180 RepID=A0A7X0P1Q3_9ACTN|nr:LacI family DNA-binding transcriptional regulator [Nonomuraea rubra]MBB6553670.1 LacI family transcriptional regulator [Nonomuraea rubra]
MTLRDVAERALVSPTTVSFVLSGRRDMRISPATEERVLQAARALGYRRTAPAIGVVSDATGHTAGEILRGCVAAAGDHGHAVLAAHGADRPQALAARGVRGFVHVSTATAAYAAPLALRGRRLVTVRTAGPAPRTPAVLTDDTQAPAVLTDGTRAPAVLADDAQPPAVLTDDTQAGRAAVAALTAAGHTTGIWLAGQALPGSGARRLSGIRTELRSAGSRLAGHVRCDWTPDEARTALAHLFGTGVRPTALIAMNDRVAMGAYQAAGAAGLSIPHDVSVISFGDSDLARWLHPGLSSVDLAYFGAGRLAVELLLAERVRAGAHRLPAELRARQSVGPPSR